MEFTLTPAEMEEPSVQRAFLLKPGIGYLRVGSFDEKTGAQKLWAGTVTIDAKAKTGPHHHGDLESVIYVVNGVARMRWGDHLEFVAEAGPGDFQEINASEQVQLHCVIARSGQQGLVVNLDITPVEIPELVRWIDDLHK